MSERLEQNIHDLASAVHSLAHQLKNDVETRISQLATKDDLHRTERHIMQAITDFSNQATQDNVATNANLDAIVTGIAALDALITSLQLASTLTAADQAALDAVSALSRALVARTSGISTAPPVTLARQGA
jgi:uncharacterized protein YPO0396